MSPNGRLTLRPERFVSKLESLGEHERWELDLPRVEGFDAVGAAHLTDLLIGAMTEATNLSEQLRGRNVKTSRSGDRLLVWLETLS